MDSKFKPRQGISYNYANKKEKSKDLWQAEVTENQFVVHFETETIPEQVGVKMVVNSENDEDDGFLD
ncbi:hypothetical protein BpHYR1_020013, partial [Brachionus plicatilis]